MKRTFLWALCAALIVTQLGFAVRSWTNYDYDKPASAGTLVFRDAEYNFSIELPDTWQMQQGYSQQDLDFVLIALSEQEGMSDGFIENMNILVDRMGQTIPDEIYFVQNLRGVMQDLPGVELLERAKIHVNGEEMHKAVYAWDGEHQRICTYQFIFTRGDKGYVVTFTTEPSSYARYRSVFDKIIGSLAFSDRL